MNVSKHQLLLGIAFKICHWDHYLLTNLLAAEYLSVSTPQEPVSAEQEWLRTSLTKISVSSKHILFPYFGICTSVLHDCTVEHDLL